MTCALLTIGTELTRGELNDTNGGWLASELTELGLLVTEIVSVDDNNERIESTLRRLAQVHRVVISTGGLGPTSDDRTSACAASFLGRPLVRDVKSLETIGERLRAHGIEMTKANEKQADFPEGSLILANSRGTAPGFSCHFGNCQFFFLPGVPTEMRPMFRDGVVPRLPARQKNISCIRLRTYGMPEAEIGDRLDGLEEKHGITLGYRASLDDIEVKVLAEGKSPQEADSLAKQVANEVKDRLDTIVYGEGVLGLAGTVGELLSAEGFSLALAESCTGGLLSELITRNPGASRYYKGGVISYSNALKTSLLGVPEETLALHGAVSEETAVSMAEGARQNLKADFALAITGVAGPDGGTQEKPVGLVHFAVARAGRTTSCHRIFRGPRERIQRRAASHALWQLRKSLLSLC